MILIARADTANVLKHNTINYLRCLDSSVFAYTIRLDVVLVFVSLRSIHLVGFLRVGRKSNITYGKLKLIQTRETSETYSKQTSHDTDGAAKVPTLVGGNLSPNTPKLIGENSGPSFTKTYW